MIWDNLKIEAYGQHATQTLSVKKVMFVQSICGPIMGNLNLEQDAGHLLFALALDLMTCSTVDKSNGGVTPTLTLQLMVWILHSVWQDQLNLTSTHGSLAAKITLIAQETNSVLTSIGKELRMVFHGPKVQPVTSKMQADAQVPTIGELSTPTTTEMVVPDGVLILNKIVLQLFQILSQKKKKELSKFP